MSEPDLIEMLRASNAQISALYAQLISITFAMVVAIYYFLNRSRLTMKLLSFVIYLVGALMFIGLMLEEANLKRLALSGLAALPEPSATTQGLWALHADWLFQTTAVFQNLGLWALIAATAFLLFVWRRPDAKD